MSDNSIFTKLWQAQRMKKLDGILNLPGDYSKSAALVNCSIDFGNSKKICAAINNRINDVGR